MFHIKEHVPFGSRFLQVIFHIIWFLNTDAAKNNWLKKFGDFLENKLMEFFSKLHVCDVQATTFL